MPDLQRLKTPCALLLALAAFLVPAASAMAASGLPPTIAMNPEAAGPGSVVEVVGLDFPPQSTIELQVTTTAGPVSLGWTVATPGGYFRQAVTLPADVEPGYWELRATGPGGATAAHIFEARTLAGSVTPDAAQVAAASAPGGLIDPNLVVTVVLLLLLVVIVCAGVFVWTVTHRRHGEAGMPIGDDPIWSGAGTDH